MQNPAPTPSRRDVLRAGAATLVAPLAATAATADAGADRPAAFEPLGSVDVQGSKEVVVGPEGDYAFVATTTGFVVVDVSDPANPSMVATEQNLTDPDGNDLKQVFDVKYDAGQLLVASGAQGGKPFGFYLYDVSDPTAPSQVGDWYPTPSHGIHNCDLADGVAYLTGNTEDGPKVVAVDVSSQPFSELDTFQPGDWKDAWAEPPNTAIHDLTVHGDYVYAAYWDAGTWILDTSDPANLSFVSRVGDYDIETLREIASRQTYIEPKGNDHYVTVNEDATVMAEGGESWDFRLGDDSGGPSGITLYDVTDEANPKRLAHIDAPTSDNNSFRDDPTWTTSHNFHLTNDRLYASWYQGGVSVHDVSDPANPERVAWWCAPDEYAFWAARLASEGECFVATSGASNGTGPGLLTFPDDAGGRMPDPPAEVEWEADGNYPSGSGDGGGATTTTTESGGGDAETTTTTGGDDGDGAGETTSGGDDGEGTESGDDAAGTTSASGTDDGTAGATTSAGEDDAGSDPTEDDADEDEATDTDGAGSTPGFGVLAALGGLGLGASRYLRGGD
jgi:hypothetical protein